MVSERYECVKCRRTFKYKGDCEDHEKECGMSEEGYWHCEYCNGKFDSRIEAENHERYYHKDIIKKSIKRETSGGGMLFFIIILIIAGIIIWGFVGAEQAKSPLITCDMGISDDMLCWQWHKNIAGQFVEGMNDLFGDKRGGR